MAKNRALSLLGRVVATVCCLAAIGCLGDLVIQGKRCPCPEAFECDAISNTCQPETSGGGGGGLPCSPSFVVSNFTVDWITANTIRWNWTPPEDLSTFGYYELWMGEGEVSSATPDAPSRRWTGSDNPELAAAALAHAQTLRPVRGTITDGLTSNTAYWGRLVAYDNNGCPSLSEPLGAHTQFVTRSVDVLVDQPPSLIYAPPDGECSHVSTDCYAGTGCVRCSLPAPNVIHIEVNVDWSEVGPDVLNAAILEFAVRNEGAPSMWSNPFLGLGMPFYNAGFEPITLPASGQYRLVQLPIDRLTTGTDGEGRALDEGDTAASLNAVNLYGDWSNSIVSIDEIRIRY